MKSPSLQMFYEGLICEYPGGVIVVEHVLFDQLQTTYLVKAPIYGEDINENAGDYWAKVQTDKLKAVCFVGAALPAEARNSYPSDLFERGFYRNLHEIAEPSVWSHSHGGLTQEAKIGSPQQVGTVFEELCRAPIEAVRHVLASSAVKEGAFALFPIG